MSAPSLARRLRFAYALPALPLAALQVSLAIFLPKFYTDVVGVSVAVVSVVLVGVRLFDAVTDPLIGWLSDRTPSRFGRRRPWMLGLSLPLAVSFYLLMQPPAEVGASTAQIWFTAGVFVTYLFWTAVAIPYESLGAEITFEYDERTAVLSLRDALLLLGTFVAAALPVALVEWGLADGPRQTYAWTAIGYGILLIVAVIVCGRFVRELPGLRSRAALSLQTMREMLENRPFRLLLVAYTISAIGSNLPGTMILYYCDYVLGFAHGERLLLLYMLTAVAALPIWVRWTRRFGKRETWLASMVVNLGSFVWAFPLGEGDVGAFTIIIAISGCGGGAAVAIPHAMQPDVIDYDEWKSGQRREGQYIGVWTFARKVAAALGVGMALYVIGHLGYEPNQPQPDAVRLAIRVFYILVPVGCYAIAFAIGWRYPIDRAFHARIRAEIEAR